MSELKGWHVFAMLLAFFGVTVAVNVYFVAAALRSSTGEYQKKSYLQGLHYNDTIAARERQSEQGWSAELAAIPVKYGGYVFEVRLMDRSNKPVDRLHFSGELRRPVQAAMDRDLRFAASGGGVYRAQTTELAPGRWHLTMAAEDGGKSTVFRAESDLWLR